MSLRSRALDELCMINHHIIMVAGTGLHRAVFIIIIILETQPFVSGQHDDLPISSTSCLEGRPAASHHIAQRMYRPIEDYLKKRRLCRPNDENH